MTGAIWQKLKIVVSADDSFLEMTDISCRPTSSRSALASKNTCRDDSRGISPVKVCSLYGLPSTENASVCSADTSVPSLAMTTPKGVLSVRSQLASGSTRLFTTMRGDKSREPSPKHTLSTKRLLPCEVLWKAR